MSRENGLEKDINFKAEAADPEKLKKLIEDSEETLSKLSGNAKKIMMDVIEKNKKKLAEMEKG